MTANNYEGEKYQEEKWRTREGKETALFEDERRAKAKMMYAA
jgi:hypothetical protein